MRQLVVRLILATAVASITAVVAAVLVVHLFAERARVRATAEADLAALVSLAETTADREALLRGLARTATGRDGRLAVHLGSTAAPDRTGGADGRADGGAGTVGVSRLTTTPGSLPPELIGPMRAGIPAEAPVAVPADGGTVLLRRIGSTTPVPAGAVPIGTPTVVEAFVPPDGPAGLWLWASTAALLALAGTAVGWAAAQVNRVRPVAADLTALAVLAHGIDAEERPPRAPAMHAPETLLLAGELDALAERFDAARVRERKLAADLSHRLRTPLTALALDAGAIGDSPAADRVRRTVETLNADVDVLISGPGRDTGPVRCDVIEVVRRRMGFWSALAQHSGRACEFRAVDAPAVAALAPDELAAVVDALLANVFRYTPDGTAFAVSVVRHAGWITLVVDDAGPGVADPAAALGRGVSSSGSTGLGLDIARDAVEISGGTIHIERAALGGARIRLRFGEVGAEHADPDAPRAWRLWGSPGRRRPGAIIGTATGTADRTPSEQPSDVAGKPPSRRSAP